MNKFRVLATDYYGNRIEQITDTMKQAVVLAKERTLDGWNVTIEELSGLSIGPTYH